MKSNKISVFTAITILASLLLLSSCGKKLSKEDWPEIEKRFSYIEHIDGTSSAKGDVSISGVLTIKDGLMTISYEDEVTDEYYIKSCKVMKNNKYSCKFYTDIHGDNGRVKFTKKEDGSVFIVEFDYIFEVYLIR